MQLPWSLHYFILGGLVLLLNFWITIIDKCPSQFQGIFLRLFDYQNNKVHFFLGLRHTPSFQLKLCTSPYQIIIQTSMDIWMLAAKGYTKMKVTRLVLWHLSPSIAAITKYHIVSSLNKRNLFSHSSRT